MFERRIKRHFSYDNKEKKEFLVTGLVLSLVMFLFVWRNKDLDGLQAIITFITIAIMSFGSLYLFISSSKLMAIVRGYEAKYTSWISGLLAGFVLTFISYGFLPIIMPGVITIKTIDRLRHGKLFFGENKKHIFQVLITAPLTSILVALLFLDLHIITGSEILYYGAIINAFLVFFSMLPIAHNIGTHLFYVNRQQYFPMLLFSLIFLVIILSTTIWWLLIGLTIVVLAVLLFNFIKKSWGFMETK